MGTERFEHLLKTEKQRNFDRDFLARWDAIEYWDTLAVGVPTQHPKTFVIEEEDVLSYNRSIGETDPLFVDPEYAKQHAPGGHVVVHPVFTTTIAFWFAQPPTPGSWIRTPGSRNPFQRIEYAERLMVGDRLTAVQENVDRFWRRDKAYMTTKITLSDQTGKVKATCYGTLILPASQEDVRRAVEA